MGIIERPQGYVYNVLISAVVMTPFLNREIVYMYVREDSKTRLIVPGFFVKEQDGKVIVQEVEVRERPRRDGQITPEQQRELELLLIRATGVNEITFWPEMSHAYF